MVGVELKMLQCAYPNEEVVSPPTESNSSEPSAMYCINDRVGSDEGKSTS